MATLHGISLHPVIELIMVQHIDYDDSGIYRPDGFTGLWEVLWPNGTLKYRSNYIDGREDGLYECYWENGIQAQLGQHERGLRQGKWVNYGVDGRIEKETYWVDGKQFNEERRYYDYDAGELMYRTTWKDGEQQRRIEYSWEGDVIADGTYKDNEPFEGTFVIYPDDDAVEPEDAIIVRYHDGKQVGRDQ